MECSGSKISCLFFLLCPRVLHQIIWFLYNCLCSEVTPLYSFSYLSVKSLCSVTAVSETVTFKIVSYYIVYALQSASLLFTVN